MAERSRILVDAAVNPDDVRSYYELPAELVERVREIAGGGGPSDTLTFDQALAAALDEVADYVAKTVELKEGLRDVATGGVTPLRQVADELRNIRQSIDWRKPPPRSLYAAIRGTETVAREALGEPAPADFIHEGKYTTLDSGSGGGERNG